jgi:hypothetical protein
MDELRNQLKSQNLSTVSPTAFGEVGGRVFPDNPSIADVNDLIQIVKGWRAVHLPSLGSPISKSATITSQTGNGDILQPTNAQVMRVQTVAFSNIDVLPQVIIAQLIDVSTGTACPFNLNPDPAAGTNALTIDAGESLSVNVDLILDSNHKLFLAVTSGDPASCEMVAYSYLTSQ